MGKLIISSDQRDKFEKVRVSQLNRGDICCWPRGSHVFAFHSATAWGEVHLVYLKEDESTGEPYTVGKDGSDPVFRLRKAGNTTPLSHIINPPTTEGNTTMPKLYQTKEETPRFGTLLATNSAGKYVIEMKGTGEVLTFDKSDVEEVKPYTVRIKFQDSSNEYDYLSRKGDVEKGDMIIVDGNGHIAKVTAVDTKSDRATKELSGRKVVTTPFGQPLVE